MPWVRLTGRRKGSDRVMTAGGRARTVAAMSTTSISTAPDLAAVKAAQQRTWSSGDYHAVAARITVIAERLVDSADLRAGSLVLDVASGSANATLAAARSGCDAVGIDYVPELLQRGRERARAEGLDVELV